MSMRQVILFLLMSVFACLAGAQSAGCPKVNASELGNKVVNLTVPLAPQQLECEIYNDTVLSLRVAKVPVRI